MTVEEMMKKKKEIGYSCKQISDLSGVPLPTVQKIFGGKTSSPRYETLRQLERVFVYRKNLETPQPQNRLIKQNPVIVLASGSPRRKELLQQAGLEFQIITSDIEEKTTSSTPSEVVLELSEQKCRSVASIFIRKTLNTNYAKKINRYIAEDEGILIVGADTVVSLDDKILGKPVDEEDALNCLMNLSGRTHEVYTGVSCIYLKYISDQEEFIENDSFNFYSKTNVKMYDFDDQDALDYIATGEPMDKAGSYGIQGIGAKLVEKIDGDYNNVVGFPLSRFLKELSGRGYISYKTETELTTYKYHNYNNSIYNNFADKKLEINDEIYEKYAYNIYSDQNNKYINKENNKNINDYLDLPEGTRIELIDGTFYNMAAPDVLHQEICGNIYICLSEHIKHNNGGCKTYIAPIDVQLDTDDKTMVQPDVLIVCNKDNITKQRIIGAPDLIVEVLSPNNYIMDTVIKLHKYNKAGVREYWIVAPDERYTIVYRLENSFEDMNIYKFDEEIPVGIWEGKCKIKICDFV